MKISNNVKEINIKDSGLNNIKIDENSYSYMIIFLYNILIYYIAYVTIKYQKYVKINSVNALHLMFNRMNVYFEEIHENRTKKYEELWIKTNY